MNLRLFGIIALIILTLSFSSALPTIYNPFTGKLDYYGLNNNTNLTQDWFFGKLNFSFIQNVPNFLLVESDPVWLANQSLVRFKSEEIAWSSLTNYPISCPAGSAIIQLNDSVTCSSFQQIYNISNALDCGDGWELGDVKISNNTNDYNCWKVANGSSDTFDLRERFIIGSGVNYSIGSTGGAVNYSFPFSGTTANNNQLSAIRQAGLSTTVSSNHNHAFSGVTNTTTVLPPYYALVYKECVC